MHVFLYIILSYSKYKEYFILKQKKTLLVVEKTYQLAKQFLKSTSSTGNFVLAETSLNDSCLSFADRLKDILDLQIFTSLPVYRKRKK
jgi:hypothetical protein